MAELSAFRHCWRRTVDIIHYLDGEHSAQYLPRVWKTLGKTRPKLIATYHQPPELLDKLIDKRMIPMLDCITVVSTEQIPFFAKLTDEKRVRLILHGIDTDFFKPTAYQKRNDEFRCITVGHYLRDFGVLCEVARRLIPYRNIEFHIVSSYAEGLGGLPNVRVYSGIGDSELLRLYQQSDALFLPLVQSTANNALLEGIACGLPVLSTYLPSVKEYLPGEEAILVKNNDPRLFIESILYLLSNITDCKRMAKAARKRAEKLDWRNIGPKYEDIYSSVGKSC